MELNLTKLRVLTQYTVSTLVVYIVNIKHIVTIFAQLAQQVI